MDFSPSACAGAAVPLQPNLRLITAQWTVLRDWDLADLRAPYWRLYWNPRPGASIRIGDTEIAIAPDQLFFIPPETSYASSVSRPTVHFYVHFQTSHRWCIAGIQALEATAADRAELRAMRAGMDRIETGWKILRFIADAIARLPPAGWEAPPQSDIRTLRAKRSIDSRLPSCIPVTELAEEAGMHLNAFIRLFRLHIGVTPARYTMLRRIEIACMLLHHSDRTIEEIAADCGFCDRYHFTRSFSKHRGISPAAFRRQSKPSPETSEPPGGK